MIITDLDETGVDAPDLIHRSMCVMTFLSEALLRRQADEEVTLSDCGLFGLVQITADVSQALAVALSAIE